jgi:hypothetical protein
MQRRRRPYLRVLLAAGVCAAFLIPPATALGQDALSNPSAAQYEPQSQVQGTDTTGSGPVAGNSTGGPGTGGPGTGGGTVGSLPFTGMDLVVLGGTAFVLLAAGFVLRRLSAPRSSIT